mmetsp:Transcript_823/g.881  ORF Transcript_823/g.881 Transcript_823/m.881 type:complete len:149 (-) Transcript_823:3005-3451(-)
MDSNAIDTALDETLTIDCNFLKVGRQEGVKRGTEISCENASDLGTANGKKIGVEIGIYYGFVDGILQFSKSNQLEVSDSALTTVSSLKNLLETFPINKALTEETHSKLLLIRAKVKVLISRVGFSPYSTEIEGESRPSATLASQSDLF